MQVESSALRRSLWQIAGRVVKHKKTGWELVGKLLQQDTVGAVVGHGTRAGTKDHGSDKRNGIVV